MKRFYFILSGLLLHHFLCAQTISQNDSARFVPPKELTTGEVTVSALRVSSKAPATFINVTKAEVLRNNLAQDLPYLLDQTPSVVTTSDAGTGIGYTGIRVRGSDPSRINVTVNGVPVNDAESHNVYWVNLPDIASSVQSIQIQRGIGTSTNGGGAFGASINIATQIPESTKPFGEMQVTAGSFNTFKQMFRAGSGWIKNKFYIEGRFSRITSDGYIDRASANLWSYYLMAAVKLKRTSIKVVQFSGREKTYQAWYGVPQDSVSVNPTFNSAGTDFGANNPAWGNQIDNYGQHYFQFFVDHQWRNNWSLNTALFTTLGKGYYEEFKVAQSVEKYQIQALVSGADTIFNTDVIRRRFLDNVYYGGSVNVRYKSSQVHLDLGAFAAQYRGKHFGRVDWAREAAAYNPNQNYYYGTATKEDVNTYAKVEYQPLNFLRFMADIQYRFVSHRTSGNTNDLLAYQINKQWHFINPKAGVSFILRGQHVLYASAALANREPTRDDLIDAANFKPERMIDAELGYRSPQFVSHVQSADLVTAIQVNGYYMDYKDQLVLTGRVNDVGNPIRVNVPESYRTGIELAGSFAIQTKERQHTPLRKQEDISQLKRTWFKFDFNFTYSVNKIKSFNETVYTYNENYELVDSLQLAIPHQQTNISFSPAYVAMLGLNFSPLRGLDIAWVNKYISRQYLDNTSNIGRSIQPYWYSNLNVSYSLPFAADREVVFTVMINNLFNRSYVSNGYTYTDRYVTDSNTAPPQIGPVNQYNFYYPQARINAIGGIRLRF